MLGLEPFPCRLLRARRSDPFPIICLLRVRNVEWFLLLSQLISSFFLYWEWLLEAAEEGAGGCDHEALQIGHHCFHKAFLYQISTVVIAGTGAGGQMLRLWILWDDCGFCNTRAKERTGPLESEVLKEKVDVKVVNL